jgi:hypothetical protein
VAEEEALLAHTGTTATNKGLAERLFEGVFSLMLFCLYFFSRSPGVWLARGTGVCVSVCPAFAQLKLA